ncbi:MvaI/BcnI family restriction endonuclease [Methanococcoides sp. NM1]|uniref:MvaI/BcnI family restriction endonuclease n=1 Tax=Methanococcoides sp. NM1 TaxID=1201013 RepID=UPI0010841080|nr:MvaI/BcnI family restriction endonuclease [Methanococcoides sp. NM1]
MDTVNFKEFPKEDLIEDIKDIMDKGWIHTNRTRNDGAVGNTLEDLLGIEENNLAIANTVDWEIKAQRKNTTSLTTLFHFDPYPRKPTVVAQHLLPNYGWAHKEAGNKYPDDEMSFRATLRGDKFSDRGFRINVNSAKRQVELVFDSSKVDKRRHEDWYNTVVSKVGDEGLSVIPYWPFDALNKKCVGKVRNTIYVLADSRRVDGQEEFLYEKLYLLEDFTFNNLLRGIIKGKLYIDFDARTGHNHGTKFRVRNKDWPIFFNKVTRIR